MADRYFFNFNTTPEEGEKILAAAKKSDYSLRDFLELIVRNYINLPEEFKDGEKEDA